GESRLAWPAPREPARAIYPIEHDLAVLGTLLEMGDAARGRGRYLLELSDTLHRSLTSRYCRRRAKWTPQDRLVHLTPELALPAAAPCPFVPLPSRPPPSAAPSPAALPLRSSRWIRSPAAACSTRSRPRPWPSCAQPEPCPCSRSVWSRRSWCWIGSRSESPT